MSLSTGASQWPPSGTPLEHIIQQPGRPVLLPRPLGGTAVLVARVIFQQVLEGRPQQSLRVQHPCEVCCLPSCRMAAPAAGQGPTLNGQQLALSLWWPHHYTAPHYTAPSRHCVAPLLTRPCWCCAILASRHSDKGQDGLLRLPSDLGAGWAVSSIMIQTPRRRKTSVSAKQMALSDSQVLGKHNRSWQTLPTPVLTPGPKPHDMLLTAGWCTGQRQDSAPSTPCALAN